MDGETVVSKNCDGRKFDNYLRFVNNHTRIIEVRMFQGYSPNCNRHQFYPQKTLSGFNTNDTQAQIDKALEAQEYKHQLVIKDLRHEMALMQLELDTKKKKLKKAKTAPEPEPKKSGMQDIKEFAELGLQLYGAFTGKAPQQQQEQLGGNTQQPIEVTVEPAKENAAQEEQPQSTAQKTFNKLMEAYGEERVLEALKWLAFLAANPSVQEKIKEQANNQKSNEHGQA